MKIPTFFRTPQRLSLTWRVIALSSLLLLALVILFTWLSHETLTRQFQENRNQHHERQQREIRLVLLHSTENLRQLAGLAAASASLGPSLQAGNTVDVEQTLDSQWPALQLEAGIDEILIINTSGQVLGNWGTINSQAQLPILSWVRQVMHTERPLTTLRCSASCQQFAAVPVLVEGESVGMVVLARSLADVTRQAKEVSGSEVALLVTGSVDEENITALRQLNAWDGYLLALTSEEQSLAPLQQAADAVPIRRLMEAPLSLEYDGKQLEISAVRMEDNNDRNSTGFLLLISDITEQIEAINQDTRTLLYVGVIGWIAAELLLLAILIGPMARLRRVAGLLPTLADGEFSAVRFAIPDYRHRLPDEIDVLESTTLDLSNQLEMLENEIQKRGVQLAERIDELANERDFVNGLLDTAQVFIVVQDSTGRISLINEYTQLMLGLDEPALLGRHFMEVFAAGAPTALNTFSLPLQEEKTLLTPDHNTHTIAWYHAPLPTGSDGKVSRISVGLDISERKAAEARLIWLAERDPLTELYNRRYFQNALQTAIERPDNVQGAILLLDLDQFKEVNELSGHHVGDKLLCAVADTLFHHLGSRGVIARLGGDEFSLLLEDINAEQAVRVAQHIAQLLDGISFLVGERRHRPPVSG